MNIDALIDRDAIRDLLARYTYNGDRGRVAELAACFSDDGVLEYPGNRAAGPDAIVAALTDGARNPAITFVRHHVTNPLIELSGETATARSYFAVTSDNGPDHSGTYSDRFVKTAFGWRFAHRTVRIDWQSGSSLFRPMLTRP
ncbi:nuclear transport factor 2 family protein [Blastomonas sp.]|uniref:nuclear transport factor 2 family protein n=1 Tax=Blastomonas sp. TaxID=1909299 RepID=UPI0026092855|nr:nuclear transport factor 2 family protein [Blastomonas sp.]MDM7957637.1 nuclear transport factor 2 family protein [Blastomonas sp.]